MPTILIKEYYTISIWIPPPESKAKLKATVPIQSASETSNTYLYDDFLDTHFRTPSSNNKLVITYSSNTITFDEEA